MKFVSSVAYLGFHFRGVQNFSGKVGVFAWREATRLVGGFGGMLHRENFKKWCNLVCFIEYFAKILSFFFLNSHFLYKNNR